MQKRILAVAATLALLSVGSISASSAATAGEARLESTIVFSSSRDNPIQSFNVAEIYLINRDGTNPRRLTQNDAGDGLAALSPDGKKIVFDSNRNRAQGEPINTSDLILMNPDGTEQTLLTRGSSATWSPDSTYIAFHASASGTGLPVLGTAGAATSDSDIFVANVDDLLTGVEGRTNVTNSPDKIEDDPDWSADAHQIAFTSRDATDPNQSNPLSAEIYVLSVDQTGRPLVDESGVQVPPQRLTYNNYEERGASWSPDGTRIVYACRVGAPLPNTVVPTFEICVINADGSNQVQLTNNNVQDLTPTWSPDGQHIVFHRFLAANNAELFVMSEDGTGVTQITDTPGNNLLANWGEIRVKVDA
jgi:Tol biopolymer transport system component